MNLFDLDDARSAGKTLVLPSPPWGEKVPTDVNHPIDLPTPRASDLAMAAQARDLATALLDTMPADLRQAATAAYAASLAAGQALRDAESELAALSGPAPTGASVEARGARLNRRAGLSDILPELRAAATVAGDRLNQVLVDVRFNIEHYTGRPLLDQERARIREMREEADRMETEAGHREIALRNAIGIIGAWLPSLDVAPVEPPTVEPVAAPPTKRRRGLFG